MFISRPFSEVNKGRGAASWRVRCLKSNVPCADTEIEYYSCLTSTHQLVEIRRFGEETTSGGDNGNYMASR